MKRRLTTCLIVQACLVWLVRSAKPSASASCCRRNEQLYTNRVRCSCPPPTTEVSFDVNGRPFEQWDSS